MQLTNRIAYTACLLAILAGGCSTKTTERGGDATAASETATRVTVYSAKEMEYIPVLNFTGTAEANREAKLGASIPGRVEKIHFARGSYIPEGALIAEMSDEMLIQAQIELEAIRKDFERMSRLREKESVSVMDFDHIKAKLDASQTKVNMLKKNTSIVAPFGGILTDVTVDEGENYTFVPSVSPDLKVQSGILTIRQLNPLKIVIEVNEKEIALIRRGQHADVVFDAYPDETVYGQVNYISPVLSPVNRTATVELTIPNRETKLKPGMFCRVSISMPQTTGVFVPINALYRQQGTGEDYLFLVDDQNRAIRCRVTRGESKENYIRIPEIKAGQCVVVDGKNKLNEGSPVEIVNK
ncbi:efflux RND transporter periplasmic adaptor subunit [Proteiniphilum sp. UBA1028]|jgi:membrane fusion protein (multidrug efflux system)|uniref:efflux RND transporter periplasmic adaptor subunit n=1 Tax=Proteiniphilum sp. UBA1028 TaxID=1947251 RepID=UPI0025EEF299|nr:efflux RND transporter periplasmic adaptor subunit [Proteiniphilum sp. UBA1028]